MNYPIWEIKTNEEEGVIVLRFFIKKNVHFITLILLITLVGTLGVSEFYYIYGESHENKRESVSELEKVGKNEFSHKIV